MHARIARTLGLLCLLSSAMSVTLVSAAQAEDLSNGGTAGLFQINATGSPLVNNKTFTGLQEGEFKILVPARNMDIKCTHGHVTEGKFLNNDTEALVSLLFLGCKPFEHKSTVLIPNCFIEDVLNSLDQRILATAIGLPRKHANKLFVLFDPDGVKFIGEVRFEAGQGCVLPNANQLTGNPIGELLPNEPIEQLVTFSEAIQKLFQVGDTGDRFKFGLFEAYLTGSYKLRLTGTEELLGFGIV